MNIADVKVGHVGLEERDEETGRERESTRVGRQRKGTGGERERKRERKGKGASERKRERETLRLVQCLASLVLNEVISNQKGFLLLLLLSC